MSQFKIDTTFSPISPGEIREALNLTENALVYLSFAPKAAISAMRTYKSFQVGRYRNIPFHPAQDSTAIMMIDPFDHTRDVMLILNGDHRKGYCEAVSKFLDDPREALIACVEYHVKHRDQITQDSSDGFVYLALTAMASYDYVAPLGQKESGAGNGLFEMKGGDA